MFRVSTTTIIRRTQNCNYSLRYWSYFLCSTSVQRGTPGSRRQPKLRGTKGTRSDTANPLFWVAPGTRGETRNPEFQVTFQVIPETWSSGRLRDHGVEDESGDREFRVSQGTRGESGNLEFWAILGIRNSG